MHRPQRLEFHYHKTTLPNASVGDFLPQISDTVVFTVMDLKEGETGQGL